MQTNLPIAVRQDGNAHPEPGLSTVSRRVTFGAVYDANNWLRHLAPDVDSAKHAHQRPRYDWEGQKLATEKVSVEPREIEFLAGNAFVVVSVRLYGRSWTPMHALDLPKADRISLNTGNDTFSMWKHLVTRRAAMKDAAASNFWTPRRVVRAGCNWFVVVQFGKPINVSEDGHQMYRGVGFVRTEQANPFRIVTPTDAEIASHCEQLRLHSP
jgi:hypothetical protein